MMMTAVDQGRQISVRPRRPAAAPDTVVVGLQLSERPLSERVHAQPADASTTRRARPADARRPRPLLAAGTESLP